MAAQSPRAEDEFNLYLSENGHLSFENPNYQLESLVAAIDPARLDDHLNSNVQSPNIFEELRYVKRYRFNDSNILEWRPQCTQITDVLRFESSYSERRNTCDQSF